MKSGRYFLPYNSKLGERAKELRKNMTPAEKKLWFGLLKGWPVRVLPQRPIGHFICPKLRLVIKVDGDGHGAEAAKAYDEERTAVLGGYGLRVLRFANADVLENFSGVCAGLERVLEGS
jgi:very-short-patch-repair endonuclease